MKKSLVSLILIGIGIIIAFPLFSMTYYTMVRTSTPEFCASCHEIKPAVVAWRSSTHTNNAAGVVVDCMDCHLPAPQDTFNFFFAKSYHGLKDVAAHFLVGEYDREHAREAAYKAFNNRECQKCHRNLLHMPTRRGPCWRTGPWCTRNPGMKRNVLTAIMTWYIRTAAGSCFVKPGRFPTRPRDCDNCEQLMKP